MKRLDNFKRGNNENGFTIVELVIGLLVIGVLTVIAVPAYSHHRMTATDSTAISDIRSSISMTESWVNTIPLGVVESVPRAEHGGIPGVKLSPGSTGEIKGNNLSYCITITNPGGDRSKNGLVYKSGLGATWEQGNCNGFTPTKHGEKNGTYTLPEYGSTPVTVVSPTPTPTPTTTTSPSPAPTATASPSPAPTPTASPSPSPTPTIPASGYYYSCGAHSFTVTKQMIEDSALLKLDPTGGWNSVHTTATHMHTFLNGILHNASGPASITIDEAKKCEVKYYINGVQTQYLIINALGVIEIHYKYETNGVRISYTYDAAGKVISEEYTYAGGITRKIDYSGTVKVLEQWFLNGKLHKEGAPAYIKYRLDGTKEEERYYLNGLLTNTVTYVVKLL